MPNPIVHFEIPVDDVERATAFYTITFGWQMNKFDMPSGELYYGVTTTDVDDKHRPTKPGEINGGLMKRKAPGQPFMNYIQVDSIDSSLQTIQANGGVVLMPKTEIAPNMGWIAAFRDTENNIMGLHELAPQFKA
jgi:uncharacterized protein